MDAGAGRFSRAGDVQRLNAGFFKPLQHMQSRRPCGEVDHEVRLVVFEGEILGQQAAQVRMGVPSESRTFHSEIRIAPEKDIPTILDLGEIMVAESRFQEYGLNRKKTAKTITAMIGQPAHSIILLAERMPGDIAGMLAGYVVDFFFCDALVAQDRFFFVKPDARGSSAAIKLLVAFRRWAEQRNVRELNINMSVEKANRERLAFMYWWRMVDRRNGSSVSRFGPVQTGANSCELAGRQLSGIPGGLRARGPVILDFRITGVRHQSL